MDGLTNDEADALRVEIAKLHGQVDRLNERAKLFEDTLRMTVTAQARAETELGETRHALAQANILANRYGELLCIILALAEGRQDLSQEVALVVQEARAVCGNA